MGALRTIGEIAVSLITKPIGGRPAQTAEATKRPTQPVEASQARRVQPRNPQQVASPVLTIDPDLILKAMSAPRTSSSKS